MIAVGTVQPDAGVYVQGQWGSIQEWYAQLPEQALTPVRFRDRQRDTLARSWAAAETRPVDQGGRVRLVASHTAEARSDQARFDVCNQLRWELSSRLGRRPWRWPVEPREEDTNGPLGCDAYELRDDEGIRRHWNLVLAASSAARHAHAEGRWGHWTRAQLKTVGDVCRQGRGEAWAALIAFVGLEQTQGRSVQSRVEQLVSYVSR